VHMKEIVKNVTYWGVVTSCILVEVRLPFGRMQRLHFQRRRLCQARISNQISAGKQYISPKFR
jgi:hypothetical protein